MAELFDSETGEIKPEAAPDSVLVAFALYQQEAARQEHWRQHRYITAPFRKSIAARLEEAGGLEAWREAIKIAGQSDWLTGKVTGKNGTRFKMDLNFLLRPASFEKVLSGFYSREPAVPTLASVLRGVGTKSAYPEPPKPFVPEPREVRLASSIESYRRYGKYQRANEIEEELAALQGRPPVLVADPKIVAQTTPKPSMPSSFRSNNMTDIEWEMIPE